MEHKRSWYIPRPSLSSNSSSNTNKSRDSIRCYHRDSEVIDIERSKRGSAKNAAASSASSSLSSQRSKNQIHMETCVDGECEASKRGSRSSQGSSDSDQSIHVRILFDPLISNLSIFNFPERILSTVDGRQLGELRQNSGAIAPPSQLISGVR